MRFAEAVWQAEMVIRSLEYVRHFTQLHHEDGPTPSNGR